MIRDKQQGIVWIVLTLLFLVFYPPGSGSGELSRVTVASPPGLILPDLSMQLRNLDEFTGKVILVNFWASWCRPCIEEVPGIRRLAEAMHDKPFVVLGVNVGEAQRRVQAAVKRLKIDYTVLLDKDGAVFKDWGATVLPTAYILDHNGRVQYIGQGPLEWDRPGIIEMLVELSELEHGCSSVSDESQVMLQSGSTSESRVCP
jgi:thiol-disulfide isomerase/thioredoxin